MASRKSSSSGPVRRSSSPTGRFCSSSSSSGFASSSTSFSSGSGGTGLFQRSSFGETRVNVYASVRFSMVERSMSPSRSISAAPRDQVVRKQKHPLSGPQKRTCTCSPTNHPGSFRCALHKTQNNQAASYTSNRLNARRSAMANSLVRIGTVEGDWVKRALAALIRPSSHHQRRRAGFQSRPSRLSTMVNSSTKIG